MVGVRRIGLLQSVDVFEKSILVKLRLADRDAFLWRAVL